MKDYERMGKALYFVIKRIESFIDEDEKFFINKNTEFSIVKSIEPKYKVDRNIKPVNFFCCRRKIKVVKYRNRLTKIHGLRGR